MTSQRKRRSRAQIELKKREFNNDGTITSAQQFNGEASGPINQDTGFAEPNFFQGGRKIRGDSVFEGFESAIKEDLIGESRLSMQENDTTLENVLGNTTVVDKSDDSGSEEEKKDTMRMTAPIQTSSSGNL